jgi:uncharacterized membrane protein
MNVIEEGTGANSENVVSHRILMLFVAGFFMVFVGMIILIVATLFYGGGSTSFGALIFIGPIPIVVGAGPEAAWMVLFVLILAVLSIMMLLIMHKGIAKKNA